MTDRKIQDYPDDKFLSQLDLFIRDKYEIVGDSPMDVQYNAFFNRFLKCGLDQILQFPKGANPLSYISKDLPKSVIETVKEAAKNKFPNPTRYWGYFLPLFNKEDSIKRLKALDEKSPEKLTVFLKELFSLPTVLAGQYAEVKTNEYVIAKEYHLALETLLALSTRNFDIVGSEMPFTHTDCFKKLRNESYEAPKNKIHGGYHNCFIERVEEYYLKLDATLPLIEKSAAALSDDEKKLLTRIGDKTLPSTFWMYYIKDTFMKIFGAPNLAGTANFINAIFKTDYTDGDIANRTR